MSDFSKKPEKTFQNFEEVKAHIAENGEHISMTRGRSMRPLFREHKDVVIIKPAYRPLKKGDVVLYPNENGSQCILHRIMRFKGDILVIRGDNNLFTEYIPKENIIGVMTDFYRDGKAVNCETSKKYKFYVFYISHTYWLRFSIRKTRVFLGKIKRKIFKTESETIE